MEEKMNLNTLFIFPCYSYYMLLRKDRKRKSLPEKATPAILKSICTGEETFGYLDENGHFVGLMMVRSKKEIFSSFCVREEDIKEIY